MSWMFLLLVVPGPFVESKDFAKELQRSALQATVRFSIGGSGVLVKKQGAVTYVLTAAHVVDGAETVQLEVFSEATYPKPLKSYGDAKVIGRSKDQDLAVLRFVTRDALPGQLAICPIAGLPTEKSFPVLTAGCLTGEAPTCLASRMMQKKLVLRPGFKDPCWFWEVSAEPDKGRSGGALIDTNGRLIGICSGRSKGHGYYCHLEEIHKFLKHEGLKWLMEEDGK